MDILRSTEFPSRLLKNMKRRLGDIIETLALLCFIGFFVCVIIQIFCRYVMQFPLQWTEEMARFLYIAVVFIAAAAVADEHLRFSSGLNFVEKRSLISYKILTLFINLGSLVVLYYLVTGSFNRVVFGWDMDMPASGLKQGYFYIPLFLGSAILTLYTLVSIWLGINGLINRGK